MNLQEGDVALRGNFGTVDENMVVKDRRAGRISETQELAEACKATPLKELSF